MIVSPVSFRPFIRQNTNNKYFSNLSFNAKIDNNNPNYKKWIDKGYKLQNSNVPLKTSTGNVSGAAFVTENKGYAEVIITDDNFKSVGSAGAYIYENDAEVCINNFYRSRIRRVGTAGYDNLFNYIRKNHPEIRKVKANITNDESYKFHKAYGFKISDEEVDINIEDYMKNYMEYPLK